MAEQEYEKLTVAKIREMFKERGIPATGLSKKQQLIDRLREVDAESGKPTEDGNDAAVGPEFETAPEEVVAETEPPAAQEAIQQTNGEATQSTSQEQSDVKPTLEKDEEPAPQAELKLSQTRSPSPKVAEDDSRKRKRRSLTPLVDEDEVAQKRQKHEEETKPAPIEPEAQEKIQGMQEEVDEDSRVEAVEAKESLPEQQEKAAEVEAAAEEAVEDATKYATMSASNMLNGEAQEDSRFRDSSTALDRNAPSLQDADRADQDDRDVEPSRHTATAALYIRNLKRPIREGQLRDHLKQLAAPPFATPSEAEDIDIQVYLDSLRTHAFARLPSITHATRIRSKLHDVVWPQEREREALFVDFIGEEQYIEFVRTEDAAVSSGRGGSMKRFEVAYIPDANGDKKAELREAGGAGPGAGTGTGVGMPGAPTGPRQASISNNESQVSRRRQTVEIPADTPSFGALGKMFRSTEAKPKLYYQPVPEDLADARRAALKDRSSSRPMGEEVGGGSGLPDSRRYTFEEQGWTEGRHVTPDGKGVGAYAGSSRLCDNGPEFGLKVPPEFRRNRGGFRGGRGRPR